MKLQVINNLCTGCGICVENCPQQAISLRRSKAYINQAICGQCGICLNTCPRGAIIEITPVSKAELTISVSSLKQKADGLVARIERLQQKGVGVKRS